MDYNEKAEMILSGAAVTLDDGKVIMIAAKYFNEFYAPAVAKQIPTLVKYKEIFKTKYYECPSCGTYALLHSIRPSYCDYCGQRLIFEEDCE